MSIVVLPEEVVARIAAGEAVERPASAVKELIENSIDAAASSIHLETVGGGKRLIRISDNGSGIPQREIALAFRRHATSKLRVTEDLHGLSTLGFRGEALASIAAVSQATVITRHRHEDMGVSLRMSGGEILQQRTIGAPAGTVVTIENLFFNTPARLKFLKKDATEKRIIKQVVTRYAMAYPNISFTLRQDGREQFRSSGRGDLADVAAQVFGLLPFKRMVEVISQDHHRRGMVQISVRGFTSQPSLTRSDRTRIILFVNGRAIRDNSLTHAVTQAYEGLIKAGAHPLAILLITIPADFVDVNVHPTKAEVRFRDAHQVFTALQRAVRQALVTAEPDEETMDLWSSSGFSNDYVDYVRNTPVGQEIGGNELYDEADLSFMPDGVAAPERPRTLPVLRVVGQIGAAYIIAEGPAGMYLVDQNSAHERVLWQQIREDLAADRLAIVQSNESKTIVLETDDVALLGASAETLSKLGFVIEEFGPNAFVIRAVPQLVAALRSNDVLPQILAQLRRGDKSLPEGITALAVVAAVKSGQILQMEEMQSLITLLERCPSPFISPTGRTILIHLTREQLASEFQRG